MAGRADRSAALILAESQGLAERMREALGDLPVSGMVIVASSGAGAASLSQVLSAALAESSHSVIALALYRPLPAGTYLAAPGLKSGRPRVAFLPLGAAREVRPAAEQGGSRPEWPFSVDAGALAFASGWVVVPTLPALAGAVRLMGRRAPLPRGPLWVVAADEGEAALLSEACEGAGLEGDRLPPEIRKALGVKLTEGVHVAARGPLPCQKLLEVAGGPATVVAGARAAISHRGGGGGRLSVVHVGGPVGIEATLQAVAALRAVAGQAMAGSSRADLAKRQAPAEPEQTGRLRELGGILGETRAELDEGDVARLLALYRLPWVETRAVRSASAAGTAAGELRFPLALRARGMPPEEVDPGTPRVEGIGSAAEARQAYRELGERWEEAQPPPALLLSEDLPHEVALEVSGVIVGEHPLLQIAVRHAAERRRRERRALQRRAEGRRRGERGGGGVVGDRRAAERRGRERRGGTHAGPVVFLPGDGAALHQSAAASSLRTRLGGIGEAGRLSAAGAAALGQVMRLLLDGRGKLLWLHLLLVWELDARQWVGTYGAACQRPGHSPRAFLLGERRL